jgi:hypothetical protein
MWVVFTQIILFLCRKNNSGIDREFFTLRNTKIVKIKVYVCCKWCACYVLDTEEVIQEYNPLDTICKKRHVVQWPPILYMPVTSLLKSSTSTESIKVRLNVVGDLICLDVFEDGDNNMYLKHLMTLHHLQSTKGVEEKLLLATKELTEKNKILEMLCKLHTRRSVKQRNTVLRRFPRLSHKSLSNNCDKGCGRCHL